MEQHRETLPTEEKQITLQRPYSRRKKIIFVIVLSLVVLVLLSSVIFVKGFVSKKSPQQMIQNALIPSPTSFPFQELTVPYLRKREYKSSLGNLEKYSESSNYTSYLTTYTSDGLRINALMTIPKSEKPEKGFPAIVFVHGYIPPTQYRTTEKYVEYIDYLAKNGFVVFKIDLRGHGQSEGNPGGGYFGSDYVVDTLNAYGALQSANFINSKAIGLWGHSMAGNILLRSFVVKPEIPAVVIWAGAVYSYVDRDKYGINDNSFRPPNLGGSIQNRRQQLMQKYGSPSATSSFWKQVIPTNYLGDLRGAIQIHHAVNDDVVNIGYSRDLMVLLDKTIVPHELWEYPTGGHNIEGVSFTQAMERTVSFFKKYLE